MLLSLFCGAGGLDLGFEQAGFHVGLAFDKNDASVNSYNRNRAVETARVADVAKLTVADIDAAHGGVFAPTGLIGGPPCQSFSRANQFSAEDDPRHVLPLAFARLLHELNARSPVSFFVMENVTGLCSRRHIHRLRGIRHSLFSAGFSLSQSVLRATNFQTPQIRERLFIVGYNRDLYGHVRWNRPTRTSLVDQDVSVRSVLQGLPDPTYFVRGLTPDEIPYHPNHWCMQPRSPRFTKEGSLRPGDGRNRSFKTLSWEKPSPTVAYGHREVHVHPNCRRRLSVYEAMRLQGFPQTYVLHGSLSSQIAQVSEAVPPPLAEAVARSIRSQLELVGGMPAAA